MVRMKMSNFCLCIFRTKNIYEAFYDRIIMSRENTFQKMKRYGMKKFFYDMTKITMIVSRKRFY